MSKKGWLDGRETVFILALFWLEQNGSPDGTTLINGVGACMVLECFLFFSLTVFMGTSSIHGAIERRSLMPIHYGL
ncbi:hypothetical protein QBC44DRAFT_337409, partial [Cladorrhinum sp. PSN332]